MYNAILTHLTKNFENLSLTFRTFWIRANNRISFNLLFHQIMFLLHEFYLQKYGIESHNQQINFSRVFTWYDWPMRLASQHVDHKDIKTFEPDFMLFTDASVLGFGAYFLNEDHIKERWISELWSKEHIRQLSTHMDERYVDSSLGEFYAAVSAIYTWKSKFSGKKVLLHSDNQLNVLLVNMLSQSPGTFYVNNQKRNVVRKLRYLKMFQILKQILYSENITVKACHISSEENYAADCLSLGRVDLFKRLYPNSFPKSKKTKNLLFAAPLQGILDTKNLEEIADFSPQPKFRTKTNVPFISWRELPAEENFIQEPVYLKLHMPQAGNASWDKTSVLASN